MLWLIEKTYSCSLTLSHWSPERSPQWVLISRWLQTQAICLWLCSNQNEWKAMIISTHYTYTAEPQHGRLNRSSEATRAYCGILRLRLWCNLGTLTQKDESAGVLNCIITTTEHQTLLNVLQLLSGGYCIWNIRLVTLSSISYGFPLLGCLLNCRSTDLIWDSHIYLSDHRSLSCLSVNFIPQVIITVCGAH